MGGIFVSYRRGASSGWALHLADDLRTAFGDDAIFMDVDSIEAGTDFVDAIERAVASCDALLAVISPDWLTATKDGRRRLDDPHDFVRLEIESALKRSVRVIPVLVGGATVPAESDLPETLRLLARRHAHEISDSRRDFDAERLVEVLEKILPRRSAPASQERRSEAPPPPPQPAPRRRIGVAAFMIAAAVLAIVGVIAFGNRNRVAPPAPETRPSVSAAGDDARRQDALHRVRIAEARAKSARKRLQEAGVAIGDDVEQAMLTLREAVSAVERGDLSAVARAEEATVALEHAVRQADDDCPEGYIWRRAFDDDRVCVSPETRRQTMEDNRLAADRREPGGGRYGPDTCRPGYVWRDAGPGDHVCVTPETRDRVATDNRAAQSRRR